MQGLGFGSPLLHALSLFHGFWGLGFEVEGLGFEV